MDSFGFGFDFFIFNKREKPSSIAICNGWPLPQKRSLESYIQNKIWWQNQLTNLSLNCLSNVMAWLLSSNLKYCFSDSFTSIISMNLIGSPSTWGCYCCIMVAGFFDEINFLFKAAFFLNTFFLSPFNPIYFLLILRKYLIYYSGTQCCFEGEQRFISIVLVNSEQSPARPQVTELEREACGSYRQSIRFLKKKKKNKKKKIIPPPYKKKEIYYFIKWSIHLVWAQTHFFIGVWWKSSSLAQIVRHSKFTPDYP